MGNATSFVKFAGVGISLAEKCIDWADKALDQDSPGGEEITPEEYASMLVIVTDTIEECLGLKVVLSFPGANKYKPCREKKNVDPFSDDEVGDLFS